MRKRQAPAERVFSVNDLQIAARHWQCDGGIPCLAIHGWLDNAVSFDLLAERLPQCDIVALDLAGNGKSSFRSANGSYNIWDDHLDILAVADELGWESFTLLGHSRGAIVSFLLAAALPDRVSRMLLFDGMLPIATEISESVRQLGSYLHDSRKNLTAQPSCYPSIQRAVEVRCKKNGLAPEECRPLVQRGMRKLGDGSYQWAHDSRLHSASAFKLSQAHVDVFLSNLVTPTLLLLAESGMGAWQGMADLLNSHAAVSTRTLEGGHHFHMSQVSIQPIVEAVEAWLV